MGPPRADRDVEEMKVERQERGDRARRRRHADEEVLLPFGPVRVVEHDVEAREPQAHRDGEDEGRDPAERRTLKRTKL